MGQFASVRSCGRMIKITTRQVYIFWKMFNKSLARATGLVRNVRYFRGNGALRDTDKTVATPTSAVPKPTKTPDPETVLGGQMHRCSNFDKWLLVWMKKFPSKDQVPDKITVSLLHKAQNQARIRTANLMMIATLIACVFTVMSGKRDAKAGKTLGKMNTDWHNRINEEYKASLAEPKTS